MNLFTREMEERTEGRPWLKRLMTIEILGSGNDILRVRRIRRSPLWWRLQWSPEAQEKAFAYIMTGDWSALPTGTVADD